ncbi:MAG: hypothetical protein ACLSWI_04910 [Candidatus Gastranaerophilaceae bacterium]
MNNVSFTGLNNFRIGKRPIAREYSTNYTEVKFLVDLNDDKFGNHFSDFISRLRQAREMYYKHCIDKRNPNSIEFKMISATDNKNIKHSIFKLNNFELILDEDSILPIYTFFARLTKASQNSKNLNETQKNNMKLINKSIMKEVSEYIDSK